MGYRQAVRHNTLTVALRWFESSYPSHLIVSFLLAKVESDIDAGYTNRTVGGQQKNTYLQSKYNKNRRIEKVSGLSRPRIAIVFDQLKWLSCRFESYFLGMLHSFSTSCNSFVPRESYGVFFLKHIKYNILD